MKVRKPQRREWGRLLLGLGIAFVVCLALIRCSHGGGGGGGGGGAQGCRFPVAS